jgi:hypothetical protein
MGDGRWHLKNAETLKAEILKADRPLTTDYGTSDS